MLYSYDKPITRNFPTPPCTLTGACTFVPGVMDISIFHLSVSAENCRLMHVTCIKLSYWSNSINVQFTVRIRFRVSDRFYSNESASLCIRPEVSRKDV